MSACSFGIRLRHIGRMPALWHAGIPHVNPEPIFMRDGKFYTSAGCTAAMDMSLALIEEDLGVATATEIAQSSLMYLRRPGRQAQISPLLKLQMSEREPLRN